MRLSLLDFDNQTMVLNNIDQISIFAADTSESSVTGVNTASLKDGVAEFDSVQFVSEIGSKGVKFNMVSKAIDNTKVSNLYGAAALVNEITVDFRLCKPGEQVAGEICSE